MFQKQKNGNKIVPSNPSLHVSGNIVEEEVEGGRAREDEGHQEHKVI